MKTLTINDIKFGEVSSSKIIAFTDGLAITVIAEEEHIDQFTYWKEETDLFETDEEIYDFMDKYSQSPFGFCTVAVEVANVDTFETHTEYLGCCNYENGFEFIKDNYFWDMFETAKSEVQK